MDDGWIEEWMDDGKKKLTEASHVIKDISILS